MAKIAFEIEAGEKAIVLIIALIMAAMSMLPLSYAVQQVFGTESAEERVLEVPLKDEEPQKAID